jgi:predicted  nucleic acid-binding Zn-ribbon protein
MPGPAAILREIHRLRRHAEGLQAEIDRGPRTLKLQQDKVARQADLLREGHEAIKKLKVAIHTKEGTLKSTNQQIDKHQLQLNQASSRKEYDALKVEIANDQKRCSDLEDEILRDMTEVDDRTAQLPELEKGVQAAKAELAQFEAGFRARQASLAEQLAQVGQDLKTVEETLPDDVRPQYERLTAARGEDALAAVRNRTCSACYTEITAQNYNDLLREQFVLCKSCGRMLYLPNE